MLLIDFGMGTISVKISLPNSNHKNHKNQIHIEMLVGVASLHPTLILHYKQAKLRKHLQHSVFKYILPLYVQGHFQPQHPVLSHYSCSHMGSYQFKFAHKAKLF